MSLRIQHNIMASNAARNLSAHYAELSHSVRRLSSGLRVGAAADDAAGLAIRELMRADIASYNQGIRNANDAISMIQTADGALQVIDEKLIRMKELAEQAATGTYNSDQRVMIDSEFQTMASEIDRIANSTDFNGVYLLNGNLQGAHDGSGLQSTGAMKIHFGPGNDAAEDYYYVNIGSCDTRSLVYADVLSSWPGAVIEGNRVVYKAYNVVAGDAGNPNSVPGMIGMDSYDLPVGLKNITINTKESGTFAHKPNVNLFTTSGRQLTGVEPGGSFNGQAGSFWWNGLSNSAVINEGINTGLFDPGATYANMIVNGAGQSVTVGSMTVSIPAGTTGQTNTPGWEQVKVNEVTSDLVFIIGGHQNYVLGSGDDAFGCNFYDIEISFELDLSIDTQGKAQEMLTNINKGIINKDKIRAHLGAMQNRLENTVSSLQVQAENLQAAESRISDVDVAGEMTVFVRNQILTQASVAMLSQANSMPQMALSLLQGQG